MEMTGGRDVGGVVEGKLILLMMTMLYCTWYCSCSCWR